MSIIDTFRRVVDPMAARQVEAERKAKREQPHREADGEPPLYRCRVCGMVAADRTYCPDCLADTMEPERPSPPSPPPSAPSSGTPR